MFYRGQNRDDEKMIERISLRLISKTPDKTIKKIFNAIKNKLKKDDTIGVGIKGESSLHKNFFYHKPEIKNKISITEMGNKKAPIIEIF